MSEILLVEDSLTQRELICDLLRNSGIKVTIATDGVEALEYIQRANPDLVVLDIVMPRMNGYEVCRRLKSDPKTKNVPVVICSYIVKPFEPIEFIYTIKQLLRG